MNPAAEVVLPRLADVELVLDRRTTGISLTALLSDDHLAVRDVLPQMLADFSAHNESVKWWSKGRGQPSYADAVKQSFPVVTLTV